MPIGTVRFSGIHNRKTCAAHDIFSQCDCFQVIGIDATMITAQVVNRETCRDRAFEMFVADAMGSILSLANVEPTIALSILIP